MRVVRPLDPLWCPRDDQWLAGLLDQTWETYFPDVPRANEVIIGFVRHWKTRLGLIRMTESEARTFIGINGLLRLREVPDVVVLITTAHELCHYAHGFGSPLPRRYAHPHAGNVVGLELQARGLGPQMREYDNWIADRWHDFYRDHAT
ncbi:MAG: hypothetical protein NZ518_12260, partial [Dehalococcoidia bacterium]|nr:hypothetical protein [Dehalococcoidia bacterium]